MILPADWDGELVNVVLPASLFVVAGEQTDIDVSITVQVKAALNSDNTDSAVSDAVTFTVTPKKRQWKSQSRSLLTTLHR